jgi:hypothetical protein
VAFGIVIQRSPLYELDIGTWGEIDVSLAARAKRPTDCFKKRINCNVPFQAPRTIMTEYKVEVRDINAYSKKMCGSNVIDYVAIKTIADKGSAIMMRIGNLIPMFNNR